uniref:Retrotransposon gag domain-containing protein n=1 Tax=Populus alba TaxID=43335 RepID=A0A4U5QW35_POPAL|nr:hypothetical protein D5086_0000049230 [Populus alba]
MDTCGKSNAEFRNEVNEALARHESSFDQVNSALQALLTELQALRTSRNPNPNSPEINPFASEGSSQFHTSRSLTPMNITPAQQVQLASFHLDGIIALQWHRWLNKFRGPLMWSEFVQAILLRFGPTEYEDPSESLTCLRQTTTVAAYQEAFERLSHQVDGLPEGFLIGCFVAGLRD